MTTKNELNQSRIVPASEVRDLFGGVSDMTLWRWLQDESLGFPRPTYIQKRRYWREADVLAWIESREAA